jgi:hypothetical protein
MVFILTLNDKNANQIAQIHGGQLDGSIVGYKDVDITSIKKQKYKNKSFMDDSDSDEELNNFNHVMNNELQKPEFYISDGEFFKIPSYKSECIFIGGARESGKSYWTKKYIDSYKNQKPKNKVVVFSQVDNDKNYKGGSNIFRVPLEEEILDNFDKDELINSLVVFDDIESGMNKQTKQKIEDLRDDLMVTGRHLGEEYSKNDAYNTCAPSVVSISHNLMNWKTTRTSLLECSHIVFFPASNTYNVKRMLQLYCGCSNDQIKRILKLNSRWVCIHKCYPMYIISSHNIFLL